MWLQNQEVHECVGEGRQRKLHMRGERRAANDARRTTRGERRVTHVETTKFTSALDIFKSPKRHTLSHDQQTTHISPGCIIVHSTKLYLVS
jgi:hypothetical protein